MNEDFIEDLTDELSDNFDGDENLDDDRYDDDEVDYYIGVQKARRAANSKTKKFSFRLTNKTGDDQNIALTNANLPVDRISQAKIEGTGPNGTVLYVGGGQKTVVFADFVNEIVKDNPVEIIKIVPDVTAVLTEGVIRANTGADFSTGDGCLVATAKGMSLQHFAKFVNDNPSQVKTIVIDVNDKAALAGSIIVKPLSPFSRTGEEVIPLSDFVDPANLNDKKIIIDMKKLGMKLQLDSQTLVLLQLPGTANGQPFVEATVQFNVGAIDNQAAKALNFIPRKRRR